MAGSMLTYWILVLETRKKFPKVAIRHSEEFREAISRTMEEQLGVERSRLAPPFASNFDRQVNDIYKNLPQWWGVSPIFWNLKSLRRKRRVWLDNVIWLGPPPNESPVNNYDLNYTR